MNKLILIATFLIISLVAIAQESTPTYDDYMKKSKSQRSVAAILLGSGSAGLIITAAADLTYALGEGLTNAFFPNAETNGKSFAAYYLTSLAVIGAGTALLVSSGKNKKKAGALETSALIKLENYTIPQPNSFRQQSIPVVGVRVNF